MEALATAALATDDATGWFDQLYREAAGDPAAISWADLEPNPLLVAWLAAHPLAPGDRVLVPGCGLGDDAALLAQHGADVTAFDVSPTALAWAARRHPAVPITWVVGDVLAPADEWRGAFDLVAEVYTLQCLPPAVRAEAFAPLARTVAPHGRLVAVGRLRADAEEPQGPPWPLAPAELREFEHAGLELETLVVTLDGEDPPVRRFVATYRAPTHPTPS
jgi:SAM-dependent methyltransferase